MIVHSGDINIFKALKYSKKGGNTGILPDLIIFPKIQAESIFILQIITHQLKRERLTYEINPIHSDNNFRDFCFEMKKKMEFKTNFLLINFGGNIQIEKLLITDFFQFNNIYILDNPIFVDPVNISSKKILLFYENFFPETSCNGYNLKKKINTEKKAYLKFPFEYTQDIFFNWFDKEIQFCGNSIWIICIRITSLFIYDKIKVERYFKYFQFLKKKLIELKKKKHSTHIQYKEEPTSFPDDILNFSAKEYPFVLWKHWTLLESFVNTPLIAIKLRIWKREGIKKLSHLFSRLGISFSQLTTQWFDLDCSVKKNLEENIEKEFWNFGIKFNKIPSFLLTYQPNHLKNGECNNQVSAIDFVQSINSILDSKLNNMKTKKFQKIFWKIYDSFSEFERLKVGFQKAKNIRKFVTKISGVILSKKTYVSEKNLRYSHIRANNHLTFNMLKELIFFLTGVFHEKGYKRKILILLVHGRNDILLFGSFYDKKYENFIRSRINYLKKKFPQNGLPDENPFFGVTAPITETLFLIDDLKTFQNK